jgi:sec-independent protein translocase protein TatA
MFGLGTTEIILIVLAILLLFGGKKIPELMRGIGQGVREFNTAKASVKSEIEEGMKTKTVTKTTETETESESKA